MGIRFSPLLYDLLRKHQENPGSRVFAPLAEAYRKSGMVDEAIEICREGLRIHPGFVGGKVALCRALFDKKEYEEVVQELSAIVQEVPDNLAAQRLMAESCLMLGRIAEALSAYKMLLYFHPQDPEVQKLVSELEAQAYEKGAIVLRRDPAPQQFQVVPPGQPPGAAIDADPANQKQQWIRKVEKLQAMLLKVENYRLQIQGLP